MFDPAGFLQVAEELCVGNEARRRTSVSRAYYGCFLILRDRLGLDKSGSPRVHQQVVGSLYAKGHHRLGWGLARLRRLRNIWDYRTDATLTSEQTQDAVMWAQSLVSEARSLWPAN